MIGLMTENGPLYCSEYKDRYRVINGHWDLGKDGRVHHPYDKPARYLAYEIVLKDMEEMDYNDACQLIEEAYDDSTPLRDDRPEKPKRKVKSPPKAGKVTLKQAREAVKTVKMERLEEDNRQLRHVMNAIRERRAGYDYSNHEELCEMISEALGEEE